MISLLFSLAPVFALWGRGRSRTGASFYPAMQIERASANNEVITVDGDLWVRALSARNGRCSLTGDPVRIGDRVYIQQNPGPRWRQRILASVVEERLGP